MTAASVPNSRAGTLPGQRRAVDELISAPGAKKVGESPGEIAIERLKQNRVFHVAVAVLVCMILACVGASWFESHWAGRTATEQNLSGTLGSGPGAKEVVDTRGLPSVGPGIRREYTLGADNLGRDVFMRILQGGKVSLLIGFAAAAITTIGAVFFGTLAGFKRGRWDAVISRYFEIQLAFPTIVLAIAISTALATSPGIGPIKSGSILVPLLIIGLVAIPGLGRIVRSQVLTLSSQEYVEAARAQGATDTRIMIKDIIPGIIPTVITYFGLIVSGVILAEAGLSFLGVGVLPPTPSWGNLIADGKVFYSTAWWICFFPGIAIMITVLSLNLIGDALKDALDPKAIGGK